MCNFNGKEQLVCGNDPNYLSPLFQTPVFQNMKLLLEQSQVQPTIIALVLPTYAKNTHNNAL